MFIKEKLKKIYSPHVGQKHETFKLKKVHTYVLIYIYIHFKSVCEHWVYL